MQILLLYNTPYLRLIGMHKIDTVYVYITRQLSIVVAAFMVQLKFYLSVCQNNKSNH